MIRAIVNSSLRSKGGILAIAVVLITLGAWNLRDARVESLPEFSPTTVEVQTEAIGLSAEEMEQLITVPLEQDLLNGVAWMESIRSQSVPGLSSIVMEFEPGTNIYRARQVVQERLNEAHALPNVSKVPAMLQPQSSNSRAMMISLSSNTLTPLEMSVLARWTIVPRLSGVPGVANVVTWGQKERQLQVLVDPQRLADNGVTLDQVISTTGNSLWFSPLSFLEASTPGTGGFIETTNQRLGVQHVSPIKTAEQLAQVPIELADGAVAGDGPPLRLGDVADVVEDHQALIGDAVVEGGVGLMLVVEKLPGANTTEVTAGIEAALDLMRPGLDGLTINTGVYRPATYIDRAGDNVARTATIGGLLLLFGLFAFLLNWRRALITAVAITLSLLAAGFVIYLRESRFNALGITGLVMALAVIIDDAVVSVDSIARRLRQQQAGDGSAAADADDSGVTGIIRDATLASARPILYGSVTMAVALLPLLLMEGLAGDSFYPQLATSFLVAVVASVLVALTVTPALSLLLLSQPGAQASDSAVGRGLRSVYGAACVGAKRHSLAVMGAGAVAAIVAVVGVVGLDRALLPPLRETDLLITWDGAAATSLPAMSRITDRAAEELRTVPGVREVGAHVGRAVRGDQVGGANSGEIWVSLDPDADYDQTVNAVEEIVTAYPGLDQAVVTYTHSQIQSVLSTTTNPVTVRVYGQDFEVLREKALEVSAILSGIDGAENVQIQRITEEPTIEIEVDLARAQEVGIKPGDVRRSATTLVSGIQVGALFEEQKIFEVQVWGVPEVRSSVTDIENLLLDLPDGGSVRLGEVADVHIGSSPTSIDHDAVSRSLDITASVEGRDVGDVLDDLDKELDGVTFPLEYHAEVVSDYEEQQDAERRLAVLSLAAAIGIVLLLQAAYGSWVLAGAMFLTLPAALMGGVVGAWIDSGTATLATVAGLLAVLAIAARQQLMMIGRLQDGDVDDGGVPFESIITIAGLICLALVPFVVVGSIPGQEIVRPMAVVIIGGLITTTLVNLLLVPAIYGRFSSKRPVPPAVLSPEG